MNQNENWGTRCALQEKIPVKQIIDQEMKNMINSKIGDLLQGGIKARSQLEKANINEQPQSNQQNNSNQFKKESQSQNLNQKQEQSSPYNPNLMNQQQQIGVSNGSDWKSKTKLMSYITLQKLELQLNKKGYSQFKYISEGGQGLVVKAYSNSIKDSVALKISKDSSEIYEDIKKEYNIVKQIKNTKNIVVCHDVLYFDELLICVIALELCQCSLQDEINQKLETNTSFTSDEICLIIIQICHALVEIHCYKIIHFDIKPSNILKAKDGTYRLADFGMSKKLLYDQESTQLNAGFTMKYISPELQKKQIENKKGDILTNKVDVFSMGLIILEVLGYPLTFIQSQQIIDGEFSKLQNIKQFKYPEIFEILCKYFLCSNPKLRIPSYQMIFEIFPSLPFSDGNGEGFQYLIKLNHSIQKKDTYDNSLHIPFVLNIKLYYFRLVFSLLKCSPNFDYFAKAVSALDIGDLSSQIGNHEMSLKYWSEALKYFEDNTGEYKIKKDVSPILFRNVSYIASLFDKIGIAFFNLGYFDKQLEYSLISFEIRKEYFDDDNPEKAESFYRVGRSYYYLKEYMKAFLFGANAVILQKKIFSPIHEKVAISCIGLSQAYVGYQDYKEGLKYSQQALDIRQQLYKENHPSLAESLHYQGFVYQKLKEYQKAIEYFKRALQMKKYIVGQNHPDIVLQLGFILDVYKSMGNNEEIKKIENEISKINKEIKDQDSLEINRH